MVVYARAGDWFEEDVYMDQETEAASTIFAAVAPEKIIVGDIWEFGFV